MNVAADNIESLIENLHSEFTAQYGECRKAVITLTPASLVVIGDHTQYNDGLMFTTAVNSYIGIAIKKEENDAVNIVYNGIEFQHKKLLDVILDSEDNVTQSLSALLRLIQERGIIPSGYSCMIQNWSSKVFGLGNSAALTVGFMSGLNEVFGLNLNQKEIVEFCVDADRTNFGELVNPSLYYSSFGQHPGSLMYFDTRSRYRKYFEFDNNYSLLLCSLNQVKEKFRELCKERIEECNIGAKGLRLYIWGIKNLRDVEESFLKNHINMIPQRLYIRCLYNVKVRKIVQEGYDNLKNHKIEEFAKRLTEMQVTLTNDYEICNDNCKKLFDAGTETSLVIGNKMLSCSLLDATIYLVKKENITKVVSKVKKYFILNEGKEPEIYKLELSKGVIIYKEKDLFKIHK